MLTQTMPAVVEALMQVLPEQAIRSLTQALGNCNQPLTHRGSLNIQPYVYGNRRGVYTGQRWNPADYRNILPTAGSTGDADMAGFNAGDWNSVNYAGGNFFFPTDQYFDESNFYGGPTTNIGGDTNFDTINVNNINTTNINTTTINGGAPGGGGGGGGGVGPATDPGIPGDPNYGSPIYTPVGGGTGSAGYRSSVLRYLRGVSFDAKVEKVIRGNLQQVEVVTGVTFDPETCDVQMSTTTINTLANAKQVSVIAPPVLLPLDRGTITVLVP